MSALFLVVPLTTIAHWLICASHSLAVKHASKPTAYVDSAKVPPRDAPQLRLCTAGEKESILQARGSHAKAKL